MESKSTLARKAVFWTDSEVTLWRKATFGLTQIRLFRAAVLAKTLGPKVAPLVFRLPTLTLESHELPDCGLVHPVLHFETRVCIVEVHKPAWKKCLRDYYFPN